MNNAKVATDVIVVTDGQCNQNCRVLGSEANAIRKMGHGKRIFTAVLDGCVLRLKLMIVSAVKNQELRCL